MLGRSYGGGVLELEPREAERIPWTPTRFSIDADLVDSTIRSRGIHAALDLVDGSMVKQGIIGKAECRTMRDIWMKMFERRKSRKSRTIRHEAEAPYNGHDRPVLLVPKSALFEEETQGRVFSCQSAPILDSISPS